MVKSFIKRVSIKTYYISFNRKHQKLIYKNMDDSFFVFFISEMGVKKVILLSRVSLIDGFHNTSKSFTILVRFLEDLLDSGACRLFTLTCNNMLSVKHKNSGSIKISKDVPIEAEKITIEYPTSQEAFGILFQKVVDYNKV